MHQTNQASRAMRADEPLMIAWNDYKATSDYQNTIIWAGKSNEGELWAAFSAGWKSAGGVVDPPIISLNRG